jgi:hypothetical protein
MLFVTVKAVEYHLANIYRKLDIKRRGQLAQLLGGIAFVRRLRGGRWRGTCARRAGFLVLLATRNRVAKSEATEV